MTAVLYTRAFSTTGMMLVSVTRKPCFHNGSINNLRSNHDAWQGHLHPPPRSSIAQLGQSRNGRSCSGSYAADEERSSVSIRWFGGATSKSTRCCGLHVGDETLENCGSKWRFVPEKRERLAAPQIHSATPTIVPPDTDVRASGIQGILDGSCRAARCRHLAGFAAFPRSARTCRTTRRPCRVSRSSFPHCDHHTSDMVAQPVAHCQCALFRRLDSGCRSSQRQRRIIPVRKRSNRRAAKNSVKRRWKGPRLLACGCSKSCGLLRECSAGLKKRPFLGAYAAPSWVLKKGVRFDSRPRTTS